MVDGRFALGAGSTIPKLELDTTAKVETDLPASLFVGDLKLTYLKSRLNSAGIPAEFAGEGVLVCGPGVKAQMEGAKVKAGSMVAVRKMGEGEVTVEGSMGKVYWQVRKEVYTSLALVPAA
jgi:cleavage and polyadenylation specificity factor subunit 2